MTKLNLSVSEAKEGHVPSLDGLRAISICLVMIQHIVSPSFPGGYGVWIFFAISGYIICRILFLESKRSGRIKIFYFYLRRFLRIYPLILLYTTIVVIVYSCYGKIDWLEPISVLTYWENYLGSIKDPLQMPFSIFWSLSIEEQFYAVFPVIFVLAKGRAGAILSVSMIAIIVALLIRVLGFSRHPELAGGHWFYFRTEYRFDAIAFGVFLASLGEIRRFDRLLAFLSKKIVVALAYAIILFCICIRNEYFKVTFCYSIIGICVAIIISSLVNFASFRFVNIALNTNFISFVGKISYSLYVWHLGVAWLLGMAMLGSSPLLRIPSELLASFLVAVASFWFVERPINSLRRLIGVSV